MAAETFEDHATFGTVLLGELATYLGGLPFDGWYVAAGTAFCALAAIGLGDLARVGADTRRRSLVLAAIAPAVMSLAYLLIPGVRASARLFFFLIIPACLGVACALTRLWSRVFLGADITRPAPVDAAARVTVPVWLVASRHDEQIPLHHAERLAAVLAANPRAEVDLTLDGRHGALPADFGSRLARYFERHLHPGGRS